MCSHLTNGTKRCIMVINSVSFKINNLMKGKCLFMEKYRGLFPIERRKKILEIVEKNGRISVSDIQMLFCVGYETAKKDLVILESDNKLKRVYGGAISFDSEQIDHSTYIYELKNFFITKNIFNKKVFLDHSLMHILSKNFLFCNNDYYTNSLNVAQLITSNTYPVRLVGNEYSPDCYTHHLTCDCVNFHLSCICLFYDEMTNSLWIDSKSKYDFYSQIISRSTNTLLLAEVKHIKQMHPENIFTFSLPNLVKLFNFGFYTI